VKRLLLFFLDPESRFIFSLNDDRSGAELLIFPVTWSKIRRIFSYQAMLLSMCSGQLYNIFLEIRRKPPIFRLTCGRDCTIMNKVQIF
jgi:hypothetical protein